MGDLYKDFDMKDPWRQALMASGAATLGGGWSGKGGAGWQGQGGAMGRGAQAGLSAYNQATTLQEAREAREYAKEQAQIKELEKFGQQASQKAGLQTSMQSAGIPLQQRQTMTGLSNAMGPEGPGKLAMGMYEQMIPKGPTDSMRNVEAEIARLQASGQWAGMNDAEKRHVMGGVPIPEAVQQPMGMTSEFDTNTGLYRTTYGPTGAPGQVAGNGQNAKQQAAAVEGAQERNMALEFQDRMGDLIYDPIMDTAVGPGPVMGKAVDYLKDSPEYHHRQKLKYALEPEILALGGKVLKGSQTEKEWDMIRANYPKDSDSPQVWRDWYKQYMKVKTKILIDDPDAQNYVRGQAGARFQGSAMTSDEADMWLNPGDEWTDAQGNTYVRD